MNNKIGIWFVFFAALVLMVNWLFRMPIVRADTFNTRIEATNRQITELKALHAEFLLDFDKEDNLFNTSDNALESEANAVIEKTKLDLAYYKAIHRLKRDPAIVASLDECAGALTGYENNLHNFFLASRERGNKNTGLVSRWLGLTKSMLTVAKLPGEEVLINLNQVKRFESEYLLYRDIRILENISIAVEEIRNQLVPEEGGINLTDIDNYLVMTGSLISIEKRMGNTASQGIIPDLENSIQNLPLYFGKAGKLMETGMAKVRIWWNIARYLIILLLTLFCAYLFVKLSGSSIFNPLEDIAGFVSKMADGELPAEHIVAGRFPVIQHLLSSLNKHIASLQEKLAFIQSINQGVLNTRLALSGEHDSFGNELIQLQQNILETAEKQAKNDDENLKRRYINEGLAKFGDILRSKNHDFNELGDTFIREIVKYLNAIQGGFFIYDDSDDSSPVLNLASSFAYNRKKFLQKSLALGEGLVGTCAREKQTINLTEIPQGYISITSGLGDTLPDNLMLVPVLHEDELIGVLEIASLHKFKDHEIVFTEEVARSMGSTIVYTRNNQRTVDLLAKSQQLAVGMTEQEEEMRQNMEELKATQEESNRREEEFRGTAEAIDKALLVMEYDLDGIIQEVNERFCIFLGRDRDEIIGKMHQEVFEGTLNPDSQFWNEVLKNFQLSFTESVKVGKKTFNIIEHFVPVINRDGITIKFINFATDDRTGNS